MLVIVPCSGEPIVRAALAGALFVASACDREPREVSAPAAPAEAEVEKRPEAPAEEAVPPKEDDAEAAPVASGLAWTIAAEPQRTKLAKLDDLRLRITVTNEGDAVANPLATVLHFSVDGEPSISLSLAFGNGAHGKEWTALEPGKSAESSRIGVEFVDAPGDHVIVISDGTTELARTTVHLDP